MQKPRRGPGLEVRQWRKNVGSIASAEALERIAIFRERNQDGDFTVRIHGELSSPGEAQIREERERAIVVKRFEMETRPNIQDALLSLDSVLHPRAESVSNPDSAGGLPYPIGRHLSVVDKVTDT